MVYSNLDKNATLGVAMSLNSSFQAKGPKVCGLSQVELVFLGHTQRISHKPKLRQVPPSRFVRIYAQYQSMSERQM